MMLTKAEAALPAPPEPRCKHCWHGGVFTSCSQCCRCQMRITGVVGYTGPKRPDIEHRLEES